MNLQTLIESLQSLLPVLGPNAPVLQHERLRVTNDRDSIQVIDPDDKIESDLVTSLRQEIAELESLPSQDAEIEELQGQVERLKDERNELEDDLSSLKDESRALISVIEDFLKEHALDYNRALSRQLDKVLELI